MTNKNIEYYDAFSKTYENARSKGYHKMLDDLETDIVYKHIANPSSKVLELGCGTGLILQRVKEKCQNSFGIDISLGMLSKSKEKKLDIVQGDLTYLPFKDKTFNLLYSFKVLAHVKEMGQAFKEFDRVLTKDGVMVLEFYNKTSLRYLIKMLKPATKTSNAFDDEAILTRYDSLTELKKLIGNDFEVTAIRGVRIFTLFAFFYKIPIFSNLIDALERGLCDSFLGKFGGFLVLIIKRK